MFPYDRTKHPFTESLICFYIVTVSSINQFQYKALKPSLYTEITLISRELPCILKNRNVVFW